MSDYRITLTLTEPEYLALARLGNQDLRSPRNQAHILLRRKLADLGILPANNPEAENTRAGDISTSKEKLT